MRTTLLTRKWAQALAPGAARIFEVDFDDALARHWESKDWDLGVVIRAGAFDAECILAGRSAANPPRWPITLGIEVADGSARWRITQPSAASLEATASSFTWEPPEGFTATAAVDGTKATQRMLTIPADAEPGEYEFTVAATCSNQEVIVQPCILTVE